MILIDTSVWIAVYRDKSGGIARRLSALVGEEPVATADCITCEVLQGTSSETEWLQIRSAMAALEQLPMSTETWIEAARIFFDLQRKAVTVRSTIDCCIAQLALAHGATLLHLDRDFERIASVRPLTQLRFKAV